MTVAKVGHDPKNDGKDHINIHPKGKTTLGRLLTSYRNVNFVHPYYGPFCSIEGFMYYIRTGCKHDDLRGLYGFEAKTRGKSYPVDMSFTKSEYHAEVLYAIYLKIRQNPTLLQMIVDSELPFDSYYLFGPSKLKISTFDCEWLTHGLSNIRHGLKSGHVPSVIAAMEAKYGTEKVE